MPHPPAPQLCPKELAPTEECFQGGILPFAENATIVRSPFGAFEDFSIPATDVGGAGDVGSSSSSSSSSKNKNNSTTFPPGSVWRRNPIPACNCDKGYNCTTNETDAAYWPYRNDTGGHHPCETGYQFTPPWEAGFGCAVYNVT